MRFSTPDVDLRTTLYSDLEKVYDRVPWENLGGAVGVWDKGVHSLDSQNESCVRVLGSQPVSFPVGVGLCQGCALSPILFVIYMDRILRRSRGGEGLQFGGLRISSPLLRARQDTSVCALCFPSCFLFLPLPSFVLR